MPAANEPVVINTSPLLALAACRQLELLRALHSRVIAPEAVITELERGQSGMDRLALEAERPAWLEMVKLASPPSPLLEAYLDAGEAAVIALALEQGIRRVVIDERRTRAVAKTMGLAVVGQHRRATAGEARRLHRRSQTEHRSDAGSRHPVE